MKQRGYDTDEICKIMGLPRVDETSLDTLDSWYDMYEEARYVASLNSDEPELKEFQTNYEASIGHWSRQKEIEGL